MSRKSLIAFPLVVLALFLQIFLGNMTGQWINFALAALVASAFFVDFADLFVLILCSVFVLNWQPGMSSEIFVFACIPLAVFALYRSKLLPFTPWLVNAIAITVCVAFFYAVFGASIFISAPRVVLLDVLGSLCAGMVFFAVSGYSRSEKHDILR